MAMSGRAAEVGHQHLDLRGVGGTRAHLGRNAVDEVLAPPSRRSSRSTLVMTT